MRTVDIPRKLTVYGVFGIGGLGQPEHEQHVHTCGRHVVWVQSSLCWQLWFCAAHDFFSASAVRLTSASVSPF